MTIEVLEGKYAVCKLNDIAQIPQKAAFFSLSITDSEISLVCEESLAPRGCKAEIGFIAMRVAGVLDFSLTGILAKISGILAAQKVSIFAVSTFDTDYVLVKEKDLERSICALEFGGYQIKR